MYLKFLIFTDISGTDYLKTFSKTLNSAKKFFFDQLLVLPMNFFFDQLSVLPINFFFLFLMLAMIRFFLSNIAAKVMYIFYVGKNLNSANLMQ